MSRIGKKAIKIPEGVACVLSDAVFSASKGAESLAFSVPKGVEIVLSSTEILVKPLVASARALWGTVRNVIANMVKGVSDGFVLELDMKGVGYRAAVVGQNIELKLGFSHDIVYPIPFGIKITCEKSSIKVAGFDRQKVGQVASEICHFRPPEPYGGSGIWRKGSYVVRKEGKKGR